MKFMSFRKGVLLALLMITVVVLLNAGAALSVMAQADGGNVEAASAASWQTWVIESGSQFRLDSPPDEAETSAEIAQLLELAEGRDDAALQQITYWDSGTPSYRWNQLAMDAVLERALPTNMALRDLALLHVAIYDATVAAWDSKYAYNRPHPSDIAAELETVIPNPASPSYPSEHAVTAGAASTILAWLFPEDAAYFQDKAQEAIQSRLLAGVEFPSDVQAGFVLGQQVAEIVIERGQTDGTDAAWTGSVPTEAGYWTGENPAFPMAGTWQTWVLDTPDQFRPAAPPAFDSEELAAQMTELREFERTPVTNAVATFWEFGAGGRRVHWFWNDVASRLVLASSWSDDAPAAARAYAMINVAGYDGMVACWDAKYTYWLPRPFQIDPEFTPLFGTPGHPSYPSAHSCISSAMGGVLVNLFPTETETVEALVSEASESRLWAGLHYRIDIEAGNEIGENVAAAVIESALSNAAP